jgi:hypothetical protein
VSSWGKWPCPVILGKPPLLHSVNPKVGLLGKKSGALHEFENPKLLPFVVAEITLAGCVLSAPCENKISCLLAK